MKLAKKDLSDVSNLVFEGFLTTDIFVDETYISLKTLSSLERKQIFNKYRHFSKNYNFFAIIDILSTSIFSIGEIEVKKENIRNYLLKSRSSFIMFLYQHYENLEKRINEVYKAIDFYLETQESRFYWGIYKNTYTIMTLRSLRKINQFQYYWIIVNSYKDLYESEKREWAKVEYMTNSICSFVNPKAYRRNKSRMQISERMSSYENKLVEREKLIERLEKSGKEEIEVFDYDEERGEFVSADKHFFDQARRSEGETKDEYVDRINDMMKKQISGEILDDHDRAIRVHELNLLKRLLLEKRIKAEVQKGLRERKNLARTEELSGLMKDNIWREEVSVIGGDKALEKIEGVTKSKGYFHNGMSYLDIVNEKAFVSIPKDKKEEAFSQVMEAEIDIEKATEVFLKNLYGKDYKEGVDDSKFKSKENKAVKPTNIGLKEEDTFGEDEEEEKLESAAIKASKMSINLKEQDLVEMKKKQSASRMGKYQSALERRNNIMKKNQSDVDEMFFK